MGIRAANLQRRSRNTAACVGIGLRFPHVDEVVTRRPDVSCFEVHAENFMFDERAVARLEGVRDNHPLLLHGVALSLGSIGKLDVNHLSRLKSLVDRFEPEMFSEHLAWSASDGVFFPDLLPLPYTQEALDIMVEHVDQTQQALGRTILIENPSSYLAFTHSIYDEASFLAELVRQTGCRILCDVNNIYVTSRNLGWDARQYLDALPAGAVGQFHLAGHTAKSIGNREILIDDHASRVPAPVWALYREAVARFGPEPTVIEWDADLPEFDVLLEEAATARETASAAATDADHADPV